MPGPLPNAQRRRTNAPVIPTTTLPPGGRPGKTPPVPEWVELDTAGMAWWSWVWRTPQAAAWAAGMEAVVARRASLEDDAAALARVDGSDLDELLEAEKLADVKRLIGRLAALAGGRTTLLREMRELDDRLGLSPKAMAALRWSIAEEAPKEKASLAVVPDEWRNATAG